MIKKFNVTTTQGRKGYILVDTNVYTNILEFIDTTQFVRVENSDWCGFCTIYDIEEALE